MVKANQLVIEVHYVLLPANEVEERRAHLRLLLLRGAMRSLQQLPQKHEPADVLSA